MTSSTKIQVEKMTQVESISDDWLQVEKDQLTGNTSNTFIWKFQAVCTLTHCLKHHEYEGLLGLLTKKERERLIKEVETDWTEAIKNNVNVAENEIHHAAIEKIDVYPVGSKDLYAGNDFFCLHITEKFL